MLLSVALVVGILACCLTVRAIARPIQSMTAAMRRLAANDTTVEIPVRDRTERRQGFIQVVYWPAPTGGSGPHCACGRRGPLLTRTLWLNQ